MFDRRGLDAARGITEADLVLRNVRIAHTGSLDGEIGDVAVCGGRIVGVGRGYAGKEEFDGGGRWLLPGFIDGHCHIESTMLTPGRFAELVVPRGTTTVVADPHEIANVFGVEGIRALVEMAREIPLDIRFMAPTCVPASAFETCRAPIEAEELVGLLQEGLCEGLGEVMNYPGVVQGDEALWAKLERAGDCVKDGHAPGLGGRDLCAYLLSGVSSDHESVTREEGLEKLRRGLWLMIREGATERNLAELLPLVLENPLRAARCMLVSDDLTAGYLLRTGHMDEKLRLATARGLDPFAALRMVTLSPAEHFRLRDRGIIAPGRRADLVVVEDLTSWRAVAVYSQGRMVAREGKPLFDGSSRAACFPSLPKTPLPEVKDLEVRATASRMRVLAVEPGQIVTRQIEVDPGRHEAVVSADAAQDLAKLVVVEKNRGSGRYATGFVRGLGLVRGAFASSVAHDAHNYIAVGMDDLSLATALRRLGDLGGGLVAVRNETILAELPLPLGGLMADAPAEDVGEGVLRMEDAVAALGATVPHPFMLLSFLSLSVIPELRLTDQGYVNIEAGGLVPLFLQ